MSERPLSLQQIRREGEIKGLEEAIETRLEWLRTNAKPSERDKHLHHFTGIGKRLKRMREIVDELDALLKELQTLQPNAT